MRKVLSLLFLTLFLLVGCTKNGINAHMYEIPDFVCEEKIDDYYYEIIDTYDDYQKNLNYNKIEKYNKNYFSNNSLIIIYIRDSTTRNKYSLNEVVRENEKLKIVVERVYRGIGQCFTIVSYCVEVNIKNIQEVEIDKIANI